MTAALLNGKEHAKALREKFKAEVADVAHKTGRPVSLLTLRVGDAEDARLYEGAINRLMGHVGIRHDAQTRPASATAADVENVIKDVARTSSHTGVLILSPVPQHLVYADLVALLPRHLDAEGTRYESGVSSGVYPPTALACFELVRASGKPLAGKRAVVVGRSKIVGRPAAELLLQADATVTICHSKTPDLKEHVASADILVAAAGRASLVKGEWIKPGAVVVDAGENVVNGQPCGDVEFEAASQRAGFITPVPGGVGPVTSLMLVRNLIALARSSGARRA